jgi:hypothetical protein
MWLKLLAVTGGEETSDALEIASDSCCPRDYDLGRILSDFEDKGATLSLVKTGRDYRARLDMNGWSMRPDGPGMLETQPVTLLRTQGPPAIFAGTLGPEQTLALFDRVVVRRPAQ